MVSADPGCLTGEPMRGHEPAVLVDAIRQDVLAEQLARPSLPDLGPAPEAADILGVRPQRLHQLVDERKDLPEPAYELRTGKLWLRAAIEAFGQRKRQPGRPRKAVAPPSTSL